LIKEGHIGEEREMFTPETHRASIEEDQPFHAILKSLLTDEIDSHRNIKFRCMIAILVKNEWASAFIKACYLGL